MIDLVQSFSAAGLLVADASGGGPTGGSPSAQIPFLIMMGAVALLFWLIILRPQRQEQKKREESINSVSKGDHVVTVGGIHGTVESVDTGRGTVSLTIAPKTAIRVNKSALASITPKSQVQKEEPEEAKAK